MTLQLIVSRHQGFEDFTVLDWVECVHGLQFLDQVFHHTLELLRVFLGKVVRFRWISSKVEEEIAVSSCSYVLVDHLPVPVPPGGEEMALASAGVGIVV